MNIIIVECIQHFVYHLSSLLDNTKYLFVWYSLVVWCVWHTSAPLQHDSCKYGMHTKYGSFVLFSVLHCHSCRSYLHNGIRHMHAFIHRTMKGGKLLGIQHLITQLRMFITLTNWWVFVQVFKWLAYWVSPIELINNIK